MRQESSTRETRAVLGVRLTIDHVAYSPVPPAGANDLADVWTVVLDRPSPERDVFRQCLSSDELQRAIRFRFAHDRNHFIVARAALRTILAFYSGVRKDQIAFEYGPFGKPTLASNSASGIELQFNVSHSHGIALVAVSRSCPLGIDIERDSPTCSLESIAKAAFSPEEAKSLAAARPRALLQHWTCKEAYVKAQGVGLSRDPGQFQIVIGDGLGYALDAARAQRADPGWMVGHLPTVDGFVAALAAESRNLIVRVIQPFWSTGIALPAVVPSQFPTHSPAAGNAADAGRLVRRPAGEAMETLDGGVRRINSMVPSDVRNMAESDKTG